MTRPRRRGDSGAECDGDEFVTHAVPGASRRDVTALAVRLSRWSTLAGVSRVAGAGPGGPRAHLFRSSLNQHHHGAMVVVQLSGRCPRSVY